VKLSWHWQQSYRVYLFPFAWWQHCFATRVNTHTHTHGRLLLTSYTIQDRIQGGGELWVQPVKCWKKFPHCKNYAIRHVSVDALCDVTYSFWMSLLIWRLEHGQKLLKWQEKPSGVYKMQENAGGRGSARTPLESLQSLPQTSTWLEGGWLSW